MVAAPDKEKALKSQVKDFLLQSKQVESVKWALGMLSNRKKHESFDTSIQQRANLSDKTTTV